MKEKDPQVQQMQDVISAIQTILEEEEKKSDLPLEDASQLAVALVRGHAHCAGAPSILPAVQYYLSRRGIPSSDLLNHLPVEAFVSC